MAARITWTYFIVSCLLLIVLVIPTLASPLKDPDLCGQPQCEDSNKFRYQTGVKYVYNYEAEVSTLFKGTSENSSTLYITSVVDFHFNSPCQGVLQISQVNLYEKKPYYDREEDEDIDSVTNPNSELFSSALSQYPLRFHFQDGVIAELCPRLNESTWVLNIKRGILSAIHNTMKRFDIDHEASEEDINGKCLTRYQLQGASGTSLIIDKHKDMDTCSHRYSHNTVIQANPYNFRSNYQAMPLVRSKHGCKFSIDNRIYEMIECEELHMFQPFSQSGNGAQTLTKMKLRFDHEVVYNISGHDTIERRTSLLFDHKATPKPTSGELRASRDLIKLMCKLESDDNKIEYPQAFTKFIRVARLLSHPALNQVFHRADSICSTGRKHVMDALPYLGSTAAVTVMREAILSKKIPDNLVQEWLLSMSFIPHPSEETLTSALYLLFHPQAHTDSQFLLSLSSLVHAYCRDHQRCHKSKSVQQMLLHISNMIKNDCGARVLDRAAQTKVEIALKALGNLGLTDENIETSVKQCIENKAISVEVRLSAIQSHRRLPCDQDRRYFLSIYEDPNFDTELRIGSYLEAMRCPNYFVIHAVRQVLENEEVNQVGSFVWSHLQNLVKSSIPSKVEIQSVLMDKDLGNKFNMDRRKFSRNYEKSLFFDEYNAGGNIESNIIFSPKSYIPRSGMLNLTVDLFGESINVFELDGRLEGFEHFLELIFGPKGPLSATEVSSRVEKYLRYIRSTPESQELQDQVNEIPNVIDNNFNVPKASLGIKIFGNELSYKTLVGDHELAEFANKLNPVRRLRQLLTGQEISFDKAAMFLDADYTVPTGLGMPVMLSTVGTAAVSMNMSGMVRNLDLFTSGKLDIEGRIKPSVAIDITGQMGLDAYYASTGIKLKTSLYSSTAVEGHIKVDGFKFVQVSFNLPKEKADIITAQSELIVVKKDVEEKQAGLTENRVVQNICSWSSLDKALGLKVCADMAFPNATQYINDITLPGNNTNSTLEPKFLLSGPSRLAVAMFKADPTADKYVLEYKWESSEDKTTISLVFDTPGSQQHREISARLLLDTQTRNLTLLLQGPDNRFQAHGKYKYTPNERYVDFSLDINGKKHIVAQIGIRKKDGKYGSTYQPKLYLAVNGERIAELSGTVKFAEKRDVAQWDVNLKFVTKKVQTTLFGYLSKSSTSASADLRLDYQFNNTRGEHVKLETRVVNKSTKSLNQLEGKFNLESSAYSHLNFTSALTYKRALGHVDCTLEINTRPELNDDRYKFTLQFSFSLYRSYERTTLTTYLQATKPISNIDMKVEIKHHGQGHITNSALVIRYATDKEVMVTLWLNYPRASTSFFVDGKLNVTLPSFTPMLFSIKVQEEQTNEFSIDAAGTWFSGHNFTAVGMYQDKSKDVVTSHALKLLLKSPSFNEIVMNGKLQIDDAVFKLDLQADHEEDKYAILLKHVVHSTTEMEIYGELKYKASVYTLTTMVDMQKHRQIVMELHLDQLRDIHLVLKGINEVNNKQAGLEVKWDANRDPGQRFAATVNFQQPHSTNYSGGFSVSYPGRDVNGAFLVAMLGTHYESYLGLDWSPTEVIDIKLSAEYQRGNSTSLRVRSQLLTPFPGWRRTSLNGGLYRETNQVRVNGSVWWQDDQTISVNIYADYDMSSPSSRQVGDRSESGSDEIEVLRAEIPDLWCAFNASLDSTVPEIKPMSASFSHKQCSSKFDTHLLLQGQPNQVIHLKSNWGVNQGPKATNVTGTIQLVSPYQGYHRGLLVGQLRYTTDLDVNGVAELDLDRKKYITTIQGHVKSFRDNMLIINVTTPLKNYAEITGRLGYSEQDRHLVCLWKSPSSALGLEILFDFRSTEYFDMMFLLATPLDFVTKLLAVAKLKTDQADFRVAWNDLQLGVAGAWHYEAPTDLEYRYTLYTPLDGFEENGIVCKIVYLDIVDVEIGVKLGDAKLGAKIQGAYKPQTLTDLNMKPIDSTSTEIEEETEDYDDEDRQPISWKGLIMIDTFFYPTITGVIDLDERDTLYILEASLTLQQGQIYLIDQFDFIDMFTMKHELVLTTPFVVFKELRSEFTWEISIGEQYIYTFDIHALAYEHWNKGGIAINYTVDNEEVSAADSEDSGVTHDAKLHLYTPWGQLPHLDIGVLVEIINNQYKSNFTCRTNSSLFTVVGKAKNIDSYTEVWLNLIINTTAYQIPEIQLLVKKHLNEIEKMFEVDLNLLDDNNTRYLISGLWHHEPRTNIKMEGNLQFPLKRVHKFHGMVNVVNRTDDKSFQMKLRCWPEKGVDVNATLKGQTLTMEAETPFGLISDFRMKGSVSQIQEKTILVGVVDTVDRIKYNVKGHFQSTEEQPVDIEVSLDPASTQQRPVTVTVKVTTTDTGHKLDGHLQRNNQHMDVTGSYGVKPDADWHVVLDVTSLGKPTKMLQLDTRVTKQENGNVSISLSANTQWETFKNVNFRGGYLILDRSGQVRGYLTVPDLDTFIECDYTWAFMEHMALLLKGSYTYDEKTQTFDGEVFYRNPKKNFKFVQAGIDADINHEYTFGTNATLSKPKLDDLGINLNLKLPKPSNEVHTVIGKLRHTNGFQSGAYTLSYSNMLEQAIYGTSGELNQNSNKTEVQGNMEVEWGQKTNKKSVNNILIMKRSDKHMEVNYKLFTPYYKDDTLVAKLSYNKPNNYYDIDGELFSPSTRRLSNVNVRYSTLANMNGTFNTTTPFKQLAFVGADFIVSSDQYTHDKKYLKLMWPNNTGLLDSDYTDVYLEDSRGTNRVMNGSLIVEIPLATRHVGHILYGYKEEQQNAIGHCVVNYNAKKIIDGNYKCVSESRAGVEKDVVDVTLENTHTPIGLHYVHSYEYSGGNDGTNYPTTDTKSGEIFTLKDRKQFNLKGELAVTTTHTGKDIIVTAIHANRTVTLETDYHFLDHEFKQRTLIKLDPNVWSGYDLHIVNTTTSEKDEEHVELNINYPKRNFTIVGHFRSDSKKHNSEITLDWDKPKEPKTFGVAMDWWRVSNKPDQQVATLIFKHPSFVKDVTFNGTYIRHGTKSLKTKLDVEYSDDNNKLLNMEANIKDLSNELETKYSCDILAVHPATKLDLTAVGEFLIQDGVYTAQGNAQYKRSFLTLQHGDLQAMINTNIKEVDMQKRLQHEESYLRARYFNDEPCCTRINGTVAKSGVFNYTGDFLLDLHQKMLEVQVNMTPDATETFHASGRVPDARNAYLNVWRSYDDAEISDIAFYLKLNHSRLVTSRLKWRPTLQKEVTSGLEYIYSSIIKDVEDTADYWREYIKSETKEAVHDIWQNAQPNIKLFLDDLHALKVLEQDSEEFKQFLNNSYNNNDFYIKDIAGAVVMLIDELAIKGHIQSLPGIINEIWQMMGESGEAVRRSLVWIIETIKNSYRKAMEFFTGIFRGESTAQLSKVLESLIEKYDKFIKNIQLSFVRQLEQLWSNFMDMLDRHWRSFLMTVEPTFIKIVHYVEQMVWNASNELLDFLYERKVEIIGSPYFARLANFTQDIDKIYRDFTQNDTITNIKKYSKIVYEFVKEKYLTYVPFGKEIQEVVSELVSEFKELQKLPSINYVVTKTNEVWDKLVWFYDSLEISTRAQTVVTLIHSKISDITQSALQAENRYRKPKTKFIFDPEEGLILLEQKLPMSWHAFNETPKFEEIPEYRTIAEVQSYFVASNSTFWTLYYEYKPYTELSNWLPPFKAQAIIAGSQHFITFDKKFIEFQGGCKYLLARDFLDGNFTLILSYNDQNKPVLALLTGDKVVSYDLYSNVIKLPHDFNNQLPADMNGLYIYRDAGVVTFESESGYVLKCNHVHHVCTFTLSGWYYGKTAGLLGTMDHEPVTDMTSSNGSIETDVGVFAHSWSLDQQSCTTFENKAHKYTSLTKDLFDKCTHLFKHKNSQFSSCFTRVDPAPFLRMCLNTNSVNIRDDICSVAVAYIEACHMEYAPLRIPDDCIQCITQDQSLIPEGEFRQIEEQDLVKSSDIVFIIEAKECNRDIYSKRNMDSVVTFIGKEMEAQGITNNRFGMVVFGGSGVFSSPRALSIDDQVFTHDTQRFFKYFQSIPIGSGTEDVFDAIRFATTLTFRPGVSKTLVLIPCSNCDPANSTMEYTVLHQVLIESDIKLHILMNSEFKLDKQKAVKLFFGIDGVNAYTKKDFKEMDGDKDLRRQVKLPKDMIGYCLPLALESNGTVFTAVKLETEKKNALKKFVSVFAQRVAQSAEPNSCQNCECTADDGGLGYMDCRPCHYPSPVNIEFDLNDISETGFNPFSLVSSYDDKFEELQSYDNSTSREV